MGFLVKNFWRTAKAKIGNKLGDLKEILTRILRTIIMDFDRIFLMKFLKDIFIRTYWAIGCGRTS